MEKGTIRAVKRTAFVKLNGLLYFYSKGDLIARIDATHEPLGPVDAQLLNELVFWLMSGIGERVDVLVHELVKGTYRGF